MILYKFNEDNTHQMMSDNLDHVNYSGEYKGDFFETLFDRTGLISICISRMGTLNVDTIMKVVMNNKSTLRKLIVSFNVLDVRIWPSQINTLVQLLESINCAYIFDIYCMYHKINYNDINYPLMSHDVPEDYTISHTKIPIEKYSSEYITSIMDELVAKAHKLNLYRHLVKEFKGDGRNYDDNVVRFNQQYRISLWLQSFGDDSYHVPQGYGDGQIYITNMVDGNE